MDETEKSIALAKLMPDWKLENYPRPNGWYFSYGKGHKKEYFRLCPYDDSPIGKFQFATILLDFSEVMARMCAYDDVDDEVKLKARWNALMPTQENILNEVLRMKGVNIQ